MKKIISLLILFCLILSMAACGTSAQWTREGYFTDENNNLISITWMELDGSEGWYVGYMVDGDMYGNFLAQEGSTLKGNVVPDYEEGTFIITISEEGENGVRLDTENGKTYHFSVFEVPQAALSVTINTDGVGQITYAETEDGITFDDGHFTSTVLNLPGPATYVFGANADEDGWIFVKWTKNGEDYSNDPIITVELTEDADFVAVFMPDDSESD